MLSRRLSHFLSSFHLSLNYVFFPEKRNEKQKYNIVIRYTYFQVTEMIIDIWSNIALQMIIVFRIRAKSDWKKHFWNKKNYNKISILDFNFYVRRIRYISCVSASDKQRVDPHYT